MVFRGQVRFNASLGTITKDHQSQCGELEKAQSKRTNEELLLLLLLLYLNKINKLYVKSLFQEEV